MTTPLIQLPGGPGGLGLGPLGCIELRFKLVNCLAPQGVGTMRPVDFHQESRAVDLVGYVCHEAGMRGDSRAKGRMFNSASSCPASDSRSWSAPRRPTS